MMDFKRNYKDVRAEIPVRLLGVKTFQPWQGRKVVQKEKNKFVQRYIFDLGFYWRPHAGCCS